MNKLKDIRGTADEDIAECLHHNRNRPAIIEKVFTPENYSFLGMSLSDERAGKALTAFFIAHAMLTPIDETCVVLKLSDYLDEDIAKSDTSHIYGLQDSADAVWQLTERLPATSAIHNDSLREWLNGRGVSDDQILKYELIDLKWARKLLDDKSKAACGASIHPALRRWVGEDMAPGWVPDGVMTPVRNINGLIIGCHNRLLSTVPKMKFCSSIPNLLLFHNLNRLSSERDTTQSIFIVEGVFDGLAMETLGCNFIAPSTGYWTPEQLLLLVSMLDNFPNATIIPFFDRDRVGIKSNLALHRMLTSLGFKTELAYFANLQSDVVIKDPAQAIHQYKLDRSYIMFSTRENMLEYYKSLPHEHYKQYDAYLSNRHASYSNDNYNWVKHTI